MIKLSRSRAAACSASAPAGWLQSRRGPRFRQDLRSGASTSPIAKVNPLPRQWMNGVRRIAHQRQAGLNILQRMTPGKREGAGRLRRHPSQPRPEVTGDLPAGAAPWSCFAADGSAPGRRTRPARPSGRIAAEEGARAAGSKLLPGAVAGISRRIRR